MLRRLADRTGDAVFLVVRDEDDSISLHREIGSYPVQILATYAGKRQPLGVGSGGMALLAALPDEVGAASSSAIPAGSTVRRHDAAGNVPIDREHPARGYSVVGNHAVRARVGCALLDAHGAPLLAVSVTAIIDRMPAQRQREIAGWIKTELARLAAQASRRGPFDGATAPSRSVEHSAWNPILPRQAR